MLNVLQIPPAELFSILAAIGFAAGLNLYATVAVLGLLAHFGHVPLPPGLLALAGWPVILVSTFLFVIEFFADKIPAFDIIWNAFHTFIRVPVAALIAFQATRQLSPQEQLVATLVGGLVALIAHSGKTAARAAVTPSPEPFSNITLSLVGDAFAIGLTWLATKHPYVAGTLAILLAVVIILLARWVVRSMRALFRGAEHELAG